MINFIKMLHNLTYQKIPCQDIILCFLFFKSAITLHMPLSKDKLFSNIFPVIQDNPYSYEVVQHYDALQLFFRMGREI